MKPAEPLPPIGARQAETPKVTADAGDFEDGTLRILELRHRMKNVLAIVQAIANQTLRSGRSIEEARKALDGRLIAMGGAVDMLLQTAWSAADLRELTARALVHGGERVTLEGPELAVGPDAAMALSLVFHELESNAIKYGALSVPAGAVTIAWSVSGADGGARLSLEWRESGGPPCRPPSRHGFGSRMISKVVGARFGGASATDYAAEGLCWRLEAPMRALGA